MNLTALIEREGIAKIERYVNRYSVVLSDGRLGIGKSVGEALAKAKEPHAPNIRKAA